MEIEHEESSEKLGERECGQQGRRSHPLGKMANCKCARRMERSEKEKTSNIKQTDEKVWRASKERKKERLGDEG